MADERQRPNETESLAVTRMPVGRQVRVITADGPVDARVTGGEILDDGTFRMILSILSIPAEEDITEEDPWGTAKFLRNGAHDSEHMRLSTLEWMFRTVSYTHLTLPTNREV